MLDSPTVFALHPKHHVLLAHLARLGQPGLGWKPTLTQKWMKYMLYYITVELLLLVQLICYVINDKYSLFAFLWQERIHCVKPTCVWLPGRCPSSLLVGSCDALLRYLAREKEMQRWEERQKNQGEGWAMLRKTDISWSDPSASSKLNI